MEESEMSSRRPAAPPPVPKVSVIVPVRDAADRIPACLEALCSQSWPADALEVIVVDDGSVDETRGRVRAYPVQLVAMRGVGSPYAARNEGLARARGEILAFTDSDCTPAKDWVAEGVAMLQAEGADLAAGQVRYRCSDPPRADELFDAIRHVDHERSVERGVAMTSNLFVRRAVFDALGPFNAERRSGEDAGFTGRATGAGYALVYAPEALAEKATRRGLALWRKQVRVGKGQLLLWRAQGMPGREMAWRTLLCLRPDRPSNLRAELRRRGPAGSERRLLRVWLAAWLFTAAQGFGRVMAALRGSG
jgi:glycosyltransferase involved in cell wall biosynthesis